MNRRRNKGKAHLHQKNCQQTTKKPQTKLKLKNPNQPTNKKNTTKKKKLNPKSHMWRYISMQ